MKSAANFHAFVPSARVSRLLIAAASVLLTLCAQWLPDQTAPYFAGERLRDSFVRLHSSTTPENRITVIDIDEASLATAGPWPWPRARIADLLENLVGPYGARGVALDLVLPERADEAGDARLAALGRHGPIVFAQAFDYVSRAQVLQVGKLAGNTLTGPGAGGVAATGYIANHAALAETRHVGNIGFVPDDDGTVRHLPMLTRFDGQSYPTLSLALLGCCSIRTNQVSTEETPWRIPYRHDWSAFTVIPAASILDLSAPAELVRDRLVLIGSSSLGLTDRVATPLSPSVSGVMVHAASLSTLLDEQAGKAVTPLPGRWIATLFAILIALIATYTFPRVSAVSNVLLLAAASGVWLVLAYWISPHDPYFSTTGPLASALFLLAVAVPFDWQISQRKSRSLLGTLRQYVATAVVDELLRSDMKNPLTPRELNVTTLIADMEGYTTYVESMSIEDAATLTRDFLDCLTGPVLGHHGTIDKYTGDGLVAFWGAPLPVDDHADLALDAAQEMLLAVRKFSLVREQNGMPPLRVRIGIESGVAMAGDFGSSSRSIYTAVGDSVNTAARLEQVARSQPHDIIVGQGAVSRSTRHRFKLLGEFVLRGKGRPLNVFTPELNEPIAVV
jgi:adenylate cyclase